VSDRPAQGAPRRGGGALLVTVTPNPSLDLLFEAGRLVWDDANRVEPPRRRPGGQGINVIRALRALGGHGLAVAPLGGGVGDELRALLDAEGTALRAVPIAGETRLFVGVRERDTGRSLLVNPRGPRLSGAEGDALLAAAAAALDESGARWLAGCGSLAPGLPADTYARLAAHARARGVRFVPDADGEALRAAAHAGCDLLVPNHHEAARLLGTRIDGPAAAAAAARSLLGFGPRLAAVTLGRDGAVAATRTGAWHARPPQLAAGPGLTPAEQGADGADARHAASAVGAGDAFLAALLLALDAGAEPPDALRSAVAAGSAVLVGTGVELLPAGAAEALAGRVTVARLD
jgi:1-phosphofructokinase